MKKTIFLLVWLLRLSTVDAQTDFINPVIRGDVADPSIIRIGDTYYASGTSSEWAPFYPLFRSQDLVNWEQLGHIFTHKPEWTSNSFWAPELFVHNGRVFCYYTARRKSDGVSYIGAASTDSPEHPFTDHGLLVEFGTEAIDAFVFDDDGQLYIIWKAYGLDNRPIELLCSRLSADGLRLEGEPFSILKDDERIGMEGQCVVRKNGYYYLIYSVRGCCGFRSDYEVYVARSKSFAGPYEKYAGNPILKGGSDEYKSCGHGTVVESPDGRWFYMCHAYLAGDGFYVGRQPIVQELETTDDHWLRFLTGAVAVRKQPMPFAGTVQRQSASFEDDFTGTTWKVDWTWNYPYTDLRASVGQGKLRLNGTPHEGNRYGTAFCVRPPTPDYRCETQVVNVNESLKGLTMYGDERNLIVWGVSADRMILKVVRRGEEQVLLDAAVPVRHPHLRMDVAHGKQLSFYYSLDGRYWQRALPDHASDGEGLTQWDRVSRPGLLHAGAVDAPAEFEYFKLLLDGNQRDVH